MRLLIIAITVATFAACTAPPPPPEAEAPIDLSALKTQFQAMDDAYAEAQIRKDAEGVLAYYTDDAHNLPDGSPTVKGKAAMLKRIKTDMASDTLPGSISFETLEVFADGDLAVYIGKSTSTTPEGETETGKFMSVMQKQADGTYLCVRDIWNSDSDDDDKSEGDE